MRSLIQYPRKHAVIITPRSLIGSGHYYTSFCNCFGIKAVIFCPSIINDVKRSDQKILFYHSVLLFIGSPLLSLLRPMQQGWTDSPVGKFKIGDRQFSFWVERSWRRRSVRWNGSEHGQNIISFVNHIGESAGNPCKA